jgi:hypothetical protein
MKNILICHDGIGQLLAIPVATDCIISRDVISLQIEQSGEIISNGNDTIVQLIFLLK